MKWEENLLLVFFTRLASFLLIYLNYKFYCTFVQAIIKIMRIKVEGMKMNRDGKTSCLNDSIQLHVENCVSCKWNEMYSYIAFYIPLLMLIHSYHSRRYLSRSYMCRCVCVTKKRKLVIVIGKNTRTTLKIQYDYMYFMVTSTCNRSLCKRRRAESWENNNNSDDNDNNSNE